MAGGGEGETEEERGRHGGVPVYSETSSVGRDGIGEVKRERIEETDRVE